MRRLSLVYVLMLVVAGAAIVGVIRLGSSLPLPEPASVTEQARPATPPEQESARANLDHPLSRLFLQLLVILAASRGMAALLGRIGQPAVIGEMAAGILLGPSLFGLLAPEAFAFVFPPASLGTLSLLSQIGVCFFMFTVGMELDVRHLRSNAHVALAVSHASIVLPYFLGVLLAYFLYSSLAAPGSTFTAFALFMGISMSITAFPVLARILHDRGLSRTVLGSTALTCAAAGDATAWSILALVVAIAGVTGLGGVALTLVLVLGFVAVMILGVRRLLPRLAREEPSTGTLAAVVFVVVGAALSTEVIGIHALFGAFLAGAIMPDTPGFREKITARVDTISWLLLPVFFAFTGLRTHIGLLNDLQGWLLCLLIIAVATLGKLGGSAVAARVAGLRWSESLQLGALMNTRGLMELIALNIGYDLGILSPRIFTMLVIMALTTTLLTAPLLTLFGSKRDAALAGRAG